MINMKLKLPSLSSIKEKLENYRRVLIVARKPTVKEFEISAKVTAIGVAIVGLIGYIIYLIFFVLGA